MPRPGTWQRIRTNDGWRIRLVGANGEIIVWSEEYKNKRDSEAALDLVRDSFYDEAEDYHRGVEFHEIDQRTKEAEPATYQAHCRDCSWTMAVQDYDQRAIYVGRHRLTTGHRVAMTAKE